MFTGLVEEVGMVAAVDHQPDGSRIALRAKTVLHGIQLGDSIAVDGVCTTVVAFDDTSFTIEASPETLSKTAFGTFQPGTAVNLERPLTPASRIGGHYVTGHVDGQATIRSKITDGISIVMTFELDSDELAQYVIPKGSIAVCGVSLTVNMIEDRQFGVALIPHTLAHTNLYQLNPGDRVNIETDLLGKYVKRFLTPMSGQQFTPVSSLNKSFLAEHGFMPALI